MSSEQHNIKSRKEGMMLKINKTLPKSKVKFLGLTLTLICGMSPLLMASIYYNSSPQVYAAEIKTLSDITNMQELTPAICGNSTLYESKTLTDVRDEKEYSVTKLDDGNCWMTSNLALELYDETNNQPVTLTPETSNVQENWESTTGVSAPWQNPVCTIENPEDCDIVKYYNGANSEKWKSEYGYYYSWNAAVVGEASTIQESGVATQDICPKAWSLPTASQYQNLLSSIENAKVIPKNVILKAPYNFHFNQSVSGGEIVFFDKSLNGRYWTKTSVSNSIINSLRIDSTPNYSDIATNLAVSTNYRYYGFGIRCVANGNTTKDTNISVTVNPTLTLDAVTGAEDIEADPSSIAYGTITATVSSNTNYIVQLSSNKPNLTDPTNHPDIEGIPASSNVVAGTNAWGILNSDNTTYSAITEIPTTYHNIETTNSILSKTHTFNLGISIANTLPSGEYSTTVTVTAVNN